jgi:DNA-binding GntR family transcriptional regulator
MAEWMMRPFGRQTRVHPPGTPIQSIHLEIVRIMLRTLHAQLHARMKRIRFRGNDIPHNWAAAVADHERIIAALEARDGPRLAALLQKHLDDSWDRLEASLAIDGAKASQG